MIDSCGTVHCSRFLCHNVTLLRLISRLLIITGLVNIQWVPLNMVLGNTYSILHLRASKDVTSWNRHWMFPVSGDLHVWLLVEFNEHFMSLNCLCGINGFFFSYRDVWLLESFILEGRKPVDKKFILGFDQILITTKWKQYNDIKLYVVSYFKYNHYNVSFLSFFRTFTTL